MFSQQKINLFIILLDMVEISFLVNIWGPRKGQFKLNDITKLKKKIIFNLSNFQFTYEDSLFVLNYLF